MTPWLLGAVGTLATGILALYWRWKLQRAADEAELWCTTAKRQVQELATAAENNRALENSCDVLRQEIKAQSDYLAAHPGSVPDYLVEQLRKAERLTAAAQPAPPRPAADLPKGSGGAGDH